MSSFEASLIGVIMIGLLHGLEPGHGWPIALLYSARTVRPTFYAFISSGIISFFHFISSIAVVGVYLLVSNLINFVSPILRYIAFIALVLLAFRLLTERVKDEFKAQHGHFHDNIKDIEHEHEHEHPGVGRHTHIHHHAKRIILSLWGIASFAFFLGFAHEEEFALLALAMGGVNPFFLMVAYASSVTVSLVGITIIGMKMYEKVRARVGRYEKYIPKISGFVLLALAIGLIIGLP
ncbi:MAG: nickel/cobalt transporter [archaeon]|nr:nickel/cobalt transporter [archaeon]MCP8319420.1 nickel/cobalt transporter [archaeon]